MFVMFNDEITHNSVEALIVEMRGFLDQALELSSPIQLYFSTNGGCVNSMYVFLKFLNAYDSIITVNLYDKLHSCGVMILTDFTGDVRLHHRTGLWMILHNGDRAVNTLARHRGFDEQNLLPAVRKENKAQIKALKKLGVSRKLLKRLKKGKDVHLFPQDVKKLKASNIKYEY